jgi:hypothetical protein
MSIIVKNGIIIVLCLVSHYAVFGAVGDLVTRYSQQVKSLDMSGG